MPTTTPRTTARARAALVVAAAAALAAGALTGTAAAQPALTREARDGAGAVGVGDPYYPKDGNGGYQVRRYVLRLAYEPTTDVLSGTATIKATARQKLTRFNLDLDGLTVRSVTVDGAEATWSRAGGELTVTPEEPLRSGRHFDVVVEYDGVPRTIDDQFGVSGFVHTDDGFLVMGQPHGASYWFPANDHPTDRASFRFEITVPEGLEAVANGALESSTTLGGETTWVWETSDPMASYLATANVGEFDIRTYSDAGITFWDAVDSDLLEAIPPPGTGQLAASSQADEAYQRLSRTLTVPPAGATLGFSVVRDTEPAWDYFIVEARPVGTTSWTTLPDVNGHTSQDTGASCPSWLGLHPALKRYQTTAAVGCEPTGTTGQWWAATGSSDGVEAWLVDLGAYAGGQVEVALTVVSDEVVQRGGVFVDDIVVSTGAGSTSLEDDGDTLDGWQVPGAPSSSPGNSGDWRVGTASDLPPAVGENALASFDRHAEMIDFLAGYFGPYPWTVGGGIVDDNEEVAFALENQTRPTYAPSFFESPGSGDSVVVHENAHQWFGDDLTVKRWKHIWLNEGFATYAEWLWAQHEGDLTAGQRFDLLYGFFGPRNGFWDVRIGDPGRRDLFSAPVYDRGAMTLHALRMKVGKDRFFRIVKRWAKDNAGQAVTTAGFVAHAERIAGRQLDGLFDNWLFSSAKPPYPGGSAPQGAAARQVAADLGPPARPLGPATIPGLGTAALGN